MNFFRLSICVIALAISSSLFCQEEPVLDKKQTKIKGALIGISEPDLILELMPLIPGLGSDSRTMLTEQSVKSYMMPPRKMEEMDKPESYSLAALLEFYSNYNDNYKVNLSPDYITLSLRQEGDYDLRSAFKFLIEEGTVSAAIMPYQTRSIPRAVFATQKFRISNYLHIIRKDMKSRQKVFETKKALMRGNPVLIQMNIPEDFKDIRDTRYWLPKSQEKNQTHPFIVVSYDQDLEAFEILSSWGNDWGDDGYLWVDYDDFGKFVDNGYVVIPN